HGWPYVARFDRTGKRLAYGSTNGDIWLWDTNSPAQRTAAARSAAEIRRKADAVVGRIVPDAASTDVALARLQDDSTIPADGRAAAIRSIRTRAGRPDALFKTAWQTVCAPGGSDGDYQRAIYIARALLRVKPDDGAYLTLLGAGRLRAGEVDAALAALRRAE